MCGIAGILAYGPEAAQVDRDELLRIREHMLKRGPDGAGLWLSPDGRLGLAHRRLAIIELSDAGAQPMLDPDTGNYIVFNGEIYNHAELRQGLQRDGYPVRSLSDTEVLLKLYVRDGVAMLKQLRGMFAFAIWDSARQQLFMARDAMGIKPLYLADDGQSLRFASQVKALLVGQVDTRPEPAGHTGFLLWGSVPEPYTLYRGIRALPAGHWQVIQQGRVNPPEPFDSPRAALLQTRVANPEATADAVHAVAQALHASVAAHMVADVPVGVFLSAGLDSNMIAASAARLGDLRTLTLGFAEQQGSPGDETVWAEHAARQLGGRHSVSRISASDFADDRPALIEAMDQPSIDGINTWFVAKMAAAQGLKVALSGIGGDELLGSYPSFVQVPKLKQMASRVPHAPGLARAVRVGLSGVAGLLPSPKYAGLLEYGATLGGAYLLRRSLYMPWEIGHLIDPDMAKAGLQELDTLARLDQSTAGLQSDRLAMSALEMQWYMRNQLLRDADWAGMAHSLEIRVPFVDTTLLRAFIETPSLAATQHKRELARVVAPELAEALLNRPKTGFAVPVHQWLNPSADCAVTRYREWGQLLYRDFAKP
jgi:asparagine synthase (glutamine-hydrolysing)